MPERILSISGLRGIVGDGLDPNFVVKFSQAFGILADGGKRGLLFNFQPNHRLTVAPLGLVSVEARAECWFLNTFHTFPEEHTVVKSQSLIEVT